MSRSDKIFLSLVCAFTLWALAIFATPLFPRTDSPGMKILEVAIAFISGIGTIGAVWVALWLSRRSDQKAVRLSETVASITSARLIHRVIAIEEAVEEVLKFLEETFAVHCEYFWAFDVFIARTEIKELEFSDEELIRIAPVEEHCAQRLAFTSESLRDLRLQIRKSEAEGCKNWPDSEQRKILQDWHMTIQQNLYRLKSIRAQLVNYAHQQPLHVLPEDNISSEKRLAFLE